MNIEINAKFAPTDRPIPIINGGTVLLTPPLDADYYLARVSFDKNAIQCFPKFTTIGIGFAKEEDWNTNLPYSSSAETIWEHIKHNKGGARITKKQGIAAIQALQDYARSLLAERNEP